MEAMSYVVDTVAFVRYLQDALPPTADKIFRAAERGEDVLFVPQIVMGEFIYLSLKNRLKVDDPAAAVKEVLRMVETSDYLRMADMDMASWEEFIELKVPELHDRMICALARTKNAAVITPDKDIAKSGIEVVWK
ncbi:MAG: PIN domain-containing protein [Candidatus Hydrothermarchaeaceae archaeon]